jgi:hypothetical protein
MFEAMVYGCVSVVHEKVDSHRWSPLAGQDIVWTVPSDPAGIAERVNELLRKPKLRGRIAKRALEFVTEYSDAKTLANMVLEFAGADLGVKDPTNPCIFYDNICEDAVPIHDFTTYELKPYVSKYAPKPREEEPVLEEAAVLEEEMAMLTASNGIVHVDPTALTGDRWIRFMTGVARAWIEAFGDV